MHAHPIRRRHAARLADNAAATATTAATAATAAGPPTTASAATFPAATAAAAAETAITAGSRVIDGADVNANEAPAAAAERTPRPGVVLRTHSALHQEWEANEMHETPLEEA